MSGSQGVEFRTALAENSPSRAQLDEMGLTQDFTDIERIARESNELGNPRVIGKWGNGNNPKKQLIDKVNYIFGQMTSEPKSFPGELLEFRERARILREGGTIDIGDLRADIISPSLKEAIQAKHVLADGFKNSLQGAARQLAGNKVKINGEIAPKGYKQVVVMELGRESTNRFSSRDELAELITKHLNVSNNNHPTMPDRLKLKHSVKEVRIIAGDNRHIFIRGKDF
jgi:hypothetical protein